MKDKNHTISIDAVKASDRIQHPFMRNTPNKVGTEGTSLDATKATQDKPRAPITLSGETLGALPLRSGTRQGCPLCTCIPSGAGSPGQGSERGQRYKRLRKGRKGKANCRYLQMTRYAEKTLEVLRTRVRTPRTINAISEATRHRVNVQKSAVFLRTYTNQEKERFREQSR